ncbi:MAG: hypothetical protein KGO22_10530, partial [Gammaproteobacteria bacterium]|nr:hypothetical protein [Gammaproteobacteria bacterium]
MSRPERLHVPRGRYFVVDEFRASEVLAPAADRTHTEAQLRDLATHRAQYEAQLAYAITRWCARVHTHCWLPGCALFEVQVGWAPLEHIMHSLRGPFSRYMRKATASACSVYAGRYRAWLLDPACTLDLRRDLCWRPVRAGLCKDPTEYRNTTIHCAFNGPTPPFLARSDVLAWLQQRQHHPRAQLMSFLSAAPSPGFAALASGSPHDRRVIGDLSFVRKIHCDERRPPALLDPRHVIEWARLLIEREDTTLMKGSPGPPPTLLSALAAWLVSCVGTASVSALATQLPTVDRSQL